MPRSYSAKQVIRILLERYDFSIVSQKGSHVKLRKRCLDGTIITIVPLHNELAHGTLRGILRLAQVEYEDFIKWRP